MSSIHALARFVSVVGAASALLAAIPAAADAGRTTGGPDGFGHLPLAFERNQGQAAQGVDFLAHGSGYALSLTQGGAELTLRNNSGPKGGASRPATTLKMRLVGARLGGHPAGAERLPGHVNYFYGTDPKGWRTDIPLYAQVRYASVYPGIDLVYYGRQGHLEYDFTVDPGSDPSEIGFTFEGAQKARLSGGDLLLRVGSREFHWRRPEIYQTLGGRRVPTQGAYVLSAHGRIGFRVSGYDRTKPLVIDPSLVYSTYLEGGGGASGKGIAADSAGNSYVIGVTGSSDFPTTPGAFQTTEGGTFITKMNATGTALVYSTFLGGGGGASGIAVDAQGDAYVTGAAGGGFPTTPGAYQTIYNGGGRNACFVTKLNPTGSALIFSTLFPALGNAIAIDNAGDAYITGQADAYLPVTAGVVEPLFGNGNGQFGSTDAFVTEINNTGTGLVYSTYLGGASYDEAYGIAVDSGGNALVTGYTESTDFPTVNPVQANYSGNQAIFITKVKPGGTGFVYSTYLSGDASNFGWAIAVDPMGNAYVAGSASDMFPTTVGAAYPTGSGPLAIKLSPTGALVYSTFLTPSSQGGGAYGIAVDSAGKAYVTGESDDPQFPTTPIAFQGTTSGIPDAFIAKLSPTGDSVIFSSLLGGSQDDVGRAIAVDGNGNAFVTGETYSYDFPTTAGAFQTTIPIAYQSFITKADTTTPLAAYITTPATGRVYYAGYTLPLSANAVDDFGTVTQVAFYAGTTLIGTATSRPFTVSWSGHPAGTYSVTAQATDSNGTTAVSSPITVTFTDPYIYQLSQEQATVGAAAITLNLTGVDFQSGATALWNGSPRTTTFVSSTQLNVRIPASDLAQAGLYPVQVVNPGSGASNTMTFTVLNPQPTITALSPRYVQPGTGAFSLSVTGSGFVPATQVFWNSMPLPTTYVSTTQLTVPVPASDVAAGGSESVTVSSPGPGGGTSDPATFIVDGTAPVTTAYVYGTKNSSGAYIGTAEVELFPSDPNPGSGVAVTDYSLDGGAPQVYANAQFPVSTPGTHTVTYHSVDNVGNTEATETTVFQIAAPPQSLSGSVSLQNVAAANMAQPMTFTLTPTGSTTGGVITQTQTLGTGGSFTLTGIPNGTYTLGIKGSKWLRKDVSVDSTGGSVTGLSVSLLGGDANGDNQVTALDLLAVKNAYNSVLGDANYNAAADFNCDGQVTALDLLIVKLNYNKTGDP